LRILHVASECFPLVKVGGLGDVIGALPQVQRAQSADARLLLPGFPGVKKGVEIKGRACVVPGTPGVGDAVVLKARTPAGVPLYVLDAPGLYGHAGNPYEERGDSHYKAAALCWVGAHLGVHGDGADWTPDIVHAHDWQAALTPLYLAFSEGKRPRSVISIHNLAYQGLYVESLLEDLKIPSEAFHMDGAEFYGQINFLKAGLAYADRILTVSPTYAKEIQTPAGGCGLDGLLSRRAADLRGILNGADYEHWSPSKSPFLENHYSLERPSAKRICKNTLQQELGLDEASGAPLFGIVSRLAPQKGLDLLLENVDYLLALGAQFALLGTGEPALEAAFARKAAEKPWQFAARIGYDEGFAHRIIAGCDVLMVPSRQEPCGLTQIYALKFGTLPLVRRTGGLADTVVDASEENLHQDVATGFVFEPETAWVLGETIGRTCALYRDHPKTWRQIQHRGMRQDFSWRIAAKHYLAFYRELSA